jgi:molybdenum cofactor guanylyltransferase
MAPPSEDPSGPGRSRRAPVAALLLTGGSSRRMGFDKALLEVDGQPNAARLAGALGLVAAGPALEVGPGRSGLPWLQESPPGAGPLVAVAAGAAALGDRGWRGPVLVVACDLPRLGARPLAVLARWPGDSSVVPTWGGAPQPLCARWAWGDLQSARRLVGEGRKSMRALLDVVAFGLLGPSDWPGGEDADELADVDEPDDLKRLGLEPRLGRLGKAVPRG